MHDSLEVIPKNLYTAIIMMGRYVFPSKLIGAIEYEFDDCKIGYKGDIGAYVVPFSGVQYIECTVTIKKDGTCLVNEKKK